MGPCRSLPNSGKATVGGGVDRPPSRRLPSNHQELLARDAIFPIFHISNFQLFQIQQSRRSINKGQYFRTAHYNSQSCTYVSRGTEAGGVWPHAEQKGATVVHTAVQANTVVPTAAGELLLQLSCAGGILWKNTKKNS